MTASKTLIGPKGVTWSWRRFLHVNLQNTRAALPSSDLFTNVSLASCPKAKKKAKNGIEFCT